MRPTPPWFIRSCLLAAVPEVTDAILTFGHNVVGLARSVRGGPPALRAHRVASPSLFELSAPASFTPRPRLSILLRTFCVTSPAAAAIGRRLS